ncbi:MAG TPA: carboxypeptidase regulatory-like domain-containing protein [Candidatus Acidoferrum sp.]|nr:carboxypeptidase regulatory-like domain-containing protein [Candidatus Acidoferrum sp.]
MRERRGAFIVVLFFLMVFSCSAQVLNGSHVIVGTVHDASSHEPLASVRIQLVAGGDDLVAAPTTSSTDGQFRLGCRKGDFYILADKSGYVPAKIKVAIGPGEETDVSIDLQRQAPQDSSTAGPPAAVSAHQLSVPVKARDAYETGMTLVNSKKDYPGALAQFQSAIDAYPAYYEAYAEIGIVHYYLGEAQAAEDALRKSVALSSGKYPYAILDLAGLLNNTARFADAEPVARQAVAADASSSRAYYELARSQLGLKRPADAEQSAAKARDLNPEYPLVYLTLTNIHLALHNYAAVLQDIDAYLKLVPDGPTSDQVRKTRAQLERALNRARSQSAALPHP